MKIKKWYPGYSVWQRMLVLLKYKCSPYRRKMSLGCYLYYGMDYLSKQEQREILLDEEISRYEKQLNQDAFREYFNSKRKFYKRFSRFIQREIFLPEEHNEEDFLDFVRRNPIFVIKPDDQYAGIGFDKIQVHNRDEETISFLKALYEKLKGNAYIAEAYVEQSEEYERIYPLSLNTVRINTMVRADGEIEVFAAVNQFGSEGSITDNDELRGIWAAIDLQTGVVCAVEKDDMTAEIYLRHPDTKLPILGFQNPKWEEMKTLAIKAAKEVKECRMIGWDICLRKDGRIELIEGNVTPELGVYQAISKRGLRTFLEGNVTENPGF